MIVVSYFIIDEPNDDNNDKNTQNVYNIRSNNLLSRKNKTDLIKTSVLEFINYIIQL